MSKNSGNPFYEDFEEVDDNAFLKNSRRGPASYSFQNDYSSSSSRQSDAVQNSHLSEAEQRRQQLLMEKRRIEERTLQSSYNSLGLIHESEKIGCATAEELMLQREQLQNVDSRLDETGANLRTSQKHITSIKSVFGSIKNYFSGGNAAETSTKPVQPERRPMQSEKTSALQKTVEGINTEESFKSSSDGHPGLRGRGLDYEDDSSYAGAVSRPSEIDNRMQFKSRSEEVDHRLNKNLESMSLGLSNLKSLARGLGDEIDDQNDMLDRLAFKVDKVDDTMQHQNRQMKRILK